MLYLNIQKGKEAMKTENFQQEIGGTESCTKRIIMAKKGCVQLISNDTYFYDKWFSGVKMAKEEMDD